MQVHEAFEKRLETKNKHIYTHERKETGIQARFMAGFAITRSKKKNNIFRHAKSVKL